MGKKSEDLKTERARKTLAEDLSSILGSLDDPPEDPVAASLMNIRIALRIIQYERQSLFANGLHMTFSPTMSGGITVNMSVL